jgi:broad specificity phosphatase PhoE
VKHLYVIRHGETDWNRERRIQGSSDIPLNDTGRAQAAAAGAALAGELVSPLIVASPLSRAYDTGLALGRAAGLAIESDARLAERSYGVWEGLTPEERRSAHPEQHDHWQAGREPALDGYETHAQVAERMRAAFDEWRSRAGGDLVFVTHGSSGRMLILSLLGLPHDSHLVGYLGNCTWSVLYQHRPGVWTLREHNQRARG